MDVVHLNPNEYRKRLRHIDARDAAAIIRRLDLLSKHGLAVGLPNIRRLNDLVWEVRVPSGLRLYFTADDNLAVFVQYGNKDTQRQDISTATSRAKELQQ